MAKVRPLSKALQEKACKELNEDVARIPDDIKAIKEWLKQKKYIVARTDDQSILTFLRGCKFSLERTKEKMETFYTLKTLLSEFMTNRDPFLPEIQEILKNGVLLPMPIPKDETVPRLMIMRSSAFDPSKIKIETVFKVNMMILDIILNEDDQTIISGMQMMQDFKGVTMAHMGTPAMSKKGMKYFQDGLPLRPKGMHMLNIPSFFETMFAMIKPFLNEKMKSRMQVHNMDKLDEFYNAVQKEQLPKEYGGNNPSIAEISEYWKKKVESYAQWFKEDEKYGTNEKLRPGKPKTTQEFFGIEGVEGSFRKLNVD